MEHLLRNVLNVPNHELLFGRVYSDEAERSVLFSRIDECGLGRLGITEFNECFGDKPFFKNVYGADISEFHEITFDACVGSFRNRFPVFPQTTKDNLLNHLNAINGMV